MEKRLGIYIHIPFCMQKCAYCDFYSITDTKRRAPYVRALIEQIRATVLERDGVLLETEVKIIR